MTVWQWSHIGTDFNMFMNYWLWMINSSLYISLTSGWLLVLFRSYLAWPGSLSPRKKEKKKDLNHTRNGHSSCSCSSCLFVCWVVCVCAHVHAQHSLLDGGGGGHHLLVHHVPHLFLQHVSSSGLQLLNNTHSTSEKFMSCIVHSSSRLHFQLLFSLPGLGPVSDLSNDDVEMFWFYAWPQQNQTWPISQQWDLISWIPMKMMQPV